MTLLSVVTRPSPEPGCRRDGIFMGSNVKKLRESTLTFLNIEIFVLMKGDSHQFPWAAEPTESTGSTTDINIRKTIFLKLSSELKILV